MKKFFILSVLIIVGSFLLAACGANTAESGQPVQLKIAAIPVLDTLPMYVAQNEGFFAAENIEVELIPVSSAPKRDELVASGQVDGMVNEIVSTIFFNRDETRIQIVRYARTATPNSPMFRILASSQSEITTVDGLKNIAIGVSQGTVIEYLTDRLLEAEGFSSDEIEVVAVPDIGQRTTLLGSGELDAAMLPDPLASLVMGQGASLVIDDSSHPEFAHSVYTFRAEFIQENPAAVQGFLRAIEKAVEMINTQPEKFNDLLAEQNLVPPPLQGKFPMPQFVAAAVPTEAQWDDVIDWVNENNLNAGTANYADSVTAEFLP